MESRLIDTLDVDKAKNIVCALVHFSGNKFEGKTRLNKAFWHAHVYHYRHNTGFLSKYPIARAPEGPVIDHLDDILVVLEREGRIEMHDQPRGEHMETVIVLKSAPPILEPDEVAAIKEGIRWVKGKSAVRVSKESHALSAAWRQGKNGEILDLAFDAMDRKDAVAMAAEGKNISEKLTWAKKLVDRSFGE